MSRDTAWFRYDGAARRATVSVHVQPGARKSGIAGLHGAALKVKVAAPAAENKANAELVAFLSEALGVARSSVTIRHGATGRRKVLEVTGDAALAARLAALV
ncbi:MAG TPA: DUF167 domain-containing protein [Burkholderiales bacterium]|nr:DUF167 domain-containing protein [Burkholderiales bacterium]